MKVYCEVHTPSEKMQYTFPAYSVHYMLGIYTYEVIHITAYTLVGFARGVPVGIHGQGLKITTRSMLFGFESYFVRN